MTPEEQALMLQQLLAARGQPTTAPSPMPSPMPSPAPVGPVNDAAAQAEALMLKKKMLAEALGGGVDPATQQAGPAGSESFIAKLAGMFGR